MKETNSSVSSAREPKILIPGLIITVEGDQQGWTVTAADMQFKERDWRSAHSARTYGRGSYDLVDLGANRRGAAQ